MSVAVIEIEKEDVRSALAAAAGQVAELLRSVPHTDLPVPGSGWTVGEMAVHLVVGSRIYTDWATGRGAPDWGVDAIAANNARFIAEIPERVAAALATGLDEGVRAFLEATADRAGDAPVSWYEGRTLRLTTATCIMLGELLVHGYDIAKSLGRPWPIDPGQARLVIEGGVSPVLPLFVEPRTARGVKASYAIRLRGGSRFVARFDDGTLTIEPFAAQPLDCYILADPVAFLLVGYGRMSQWAAIARGKMIAWGRKPWLSLQFTSLLKKP